MHNISLAAFSDFQLLTNWMADRSLHSNNEKSRKYKDVQEYDSLFQQGHGAGILTHCLPQGRQFVKQMLQINH